MRSIPILLVVALLLPAQAHAAGRYGWPLQPRPRLVTAYDPPAQRWQSGHRGVDLAAAVGQPVLAAGDGTVTFAGRVGGKPVVAIRHSPTLWTTYEPVEAKVAVGDSVRRGDVVGVVREGHEGCPVAICLHWGARTGSGHDAGYRNPLGLVGGLRVRLYPVS
ncbi:M23 family metallopeptidase [Gordonia sp. X0973]|uniref:M23 family metallopeptidase n=1 Tax=Gordonia sp. X0973 TaxID=2742602 RepID=UPI000F536420|nr:M23 family metallopeptidase [Gordonia sp. X0973]QKT07048.1 M23 family metallopeptidase [Gordonia sp. X0973]